MHKFLFYNKFILFLNMFRTLLCSKHVEAYNKLIIKEHFVHQVGLLLRLYRAARSAKRQNLLFFLLFVLQLPVTQSI